MSYTLLAFLPNSTAAAVGSLLLDWAIKGVAVVLAAAIVVIAMRRASAAMRHLVWTAGMVCLLLLPLISLVAPKWEALPDWRRSELSNSGSVRASATKGMIPGSDSDGTIHVHQRGGDPVSAANALPSNAAVAIHDPSVVQSGAPSFQSPVSVEARVASVPYCLLAATWVWGIVGALLILRIVLSRYVLGRVVRTASAIQDGSIASRLRAAQERYSIRHKVYAHLSGERDLPLTWGIFRMRILLPLEARQWPAGRLEAVLMHELAHIKRGDTITHVVCQLVCALYWINPLVWLAAWRIHVERERACDDLVLAGGIRATEYAQYLLDIVCGARARRGELATAIAMARA
jgi:beta-lactamase regulating signal transducer with metallopeptidase domain